MIYINLPWKYHKKHDTFMNNIFLLSCYDIFKTYIFMSFIINRSISCSIFIFLTIYSTQKASIMGLTTSVWNWFIYFLVVLKYFYLQNAINKIFSFLLLILLLQKNSLNGVVRVLGSKRHNVSTLRKFFLSVSL